MIIAYRFGSSLMNIATLLFWSAGAVVVYAYAIFPLLLAVLSRCFGEHAEPEEGAPGPPPLPRVAMVVAAYNEARVLEAKLRNSWQIDYPADRFEILIGSDGSTDATGDILKGCGDSRLRAFLFPDRRGKISILNDLLAQVDADIVVMSDANTVFEPGAVRKMVRHFQDPRIGCVSGELVLEQEGGVSGEGIYWKYEGWIKRNESRLGFLIGCNGGIFALRRELYRDLPASTIVEDFVLSMSVLLQGYRVRFEPQARAVEPACASSGAEMVRKIRIGAGGWQALELTRPLLHPRHGLVAFAFWGHKVVRWLVPFCLALALISNACLLGSVLYDSLMALQASGLLIAAWVYLSPPHGPALKVFRPISYFYLMNYSLFCGFLRYVFKTQRVTWERANQADAMLVTDLPTLESTPAAPAIVPAAGEGGRTLPGEGPHAHTTVSR